MPRRYDSAACVTELIAKSTISSALRAGWKIAAPGCVPEAVPIVDANPQLAPPAKKPKKAKDRVQISETSVIEM
jgi:hypothetical protein